jgi:hypothetical protein
MTKKTEKEARCIELLRDIVKPGDTVYTVLKHVSASGMSRDIDVFVFHVVDGKIQKSWLSNLMAGAGIATFNRNRECLRVGGCGMDMGFHVVYTLASVLGYTRYHAEDKQDAAPNTNCYGLNHEWL